MNSSSPTIITDFDHCAAALELNLAYGYMVRFEHVCQRGSRIPARVKTAMERIYQTIHKLHQEMRQVQERTQAVDRRRSTCWGEPEEPRPTPILRKRGVSMTLDDHAAAARELGQAQRADLRFLRIVSDRSQVPVRVLDMALQIENRIHAICCAMDDLQFLTLRGEERNVPCWLGRFNHFDGDEDGDPGRPILEEWK